MADTTLLELCQELMATFDSAIDTADGSAFRTQVLDPLLTRIGDSPLNVDPGTFLVARLREEFTDMDLSRYSGFRDLFVRAALILVEPLRREVAGIKISQSLDNYSLMTTTELQALLSNYFITMGAGTLATGPVRVYFTSPQTVMVTTLTNFFTGGKLNFYPTATQSVSATVMTFQQESGLYYAEFSVQAEEAGDAYNAEAGDINGVSGIAGVVKVSNPYALTPGVNAETKEEAVARAKDSITLRTLSVSRGIKFLIQESFSFADTIQVIGKGDEEMRRDIVVGPVTISGIPDSYLTGTEDPEVPTGGTIHIGGKTDVYVYQETPVEDTLDIQNITDAGVRIFSSTTGFTSQSSTGTVTTLRDRRGNFIKNGVRTGDYLRFSTETGFVTDLLQVTHVSDFYLDLDGTLTSALFEQTYEVVRLDTTGTLLRIPLYDLVAMTDGSPVTDDNGDYVQASPGDASVSALRDSEGVYVPKTENIGSANVSLPLIWVKQVEFLEALSLQPTDEIVPQAHLLLVSNVEAIAGGTSSVAATGSLRLYFRDAVNVYFPQDVRFYLGARRYRVDYTQVGTAEIVGGVLKLVGDLTGSVHKGYRILLSGSVYTITADPTYDSGSLRTLLTVREDLVDAAGASFRAFVGQLQSEMETEDNGLYYMDVSVIAISTGADGNLDAGATLTGTGVYAEGWTLHATRPEHSLSTRDLPYLQVSSWVNDVVNLREESTAYAIRVTYMTATSLPDVQAFVDSDDNRIVAEDVLVRHFLPSLVRGSLIVDPNLDTEIAKAALVTYLNEIDPLENLEISDVSGALKDEGATYVKMPVVLLVFQQQPDRSWQATILEDRLAANRVHHFIADEDSLSVTAET